MESTEFENVLEHDIVQRAIGVAKAHGKWPWDWSQFSFPENDDGLAAILAVSDLLDEDSLRCDTGTLLKHRHGTSSNCAHWLRHGLTLNRVVVERGIINVNLGRPPHSDAQLGVVFDALRNHYKLVNLYFTQLSSIGAGLIDIIFDHPGVPTTIAQNLNGWNQLPNFQNQSALRYHLIDSFMAEALLDERRLQQTCLDQLKNLGLTKIQLDFYYEIKSSLPPRTQTEQEFHALIGGAI